ncbi:hypothetical protein SELR_08160 [Selenomonas ruminantium subsp. lactilytica TAM6421]|uniref:Lipoprotein n=2 Tax=Selenomonas ruminantium TaxID=971 RepID=A0A1H0U3S1_SELRU|nr:hypothetical protein [Selenomonas ruminantium]BAL82524.1 hypothetical protein SELR_08160 [Selenomonas ruminantium subsp. lactilytica TAM6421]SDP60486.1 hypothetical protein SAMN05216366_12815 [Selenomonas ruminantium]
MKKITMAFICFCSTLSLLYTAMNYKVNGDAFQKDPQIILEIYEDLPIPECTKEVKKKDKSRPRSSVFLKVYYYTELSNEQIMNFYVEQFTKRGWKQIEYKGGIGVLFKKDDWKIAVNKGEENYSLEIFKFYGVAD